MIHICWACSVSLPDGHTALDYAPECEMYLCDPDAARRIGVIEANPRVPEECDDEYEGAS